MARSLLSSPQPYLALDRYRQILNIPIYRFNGMENPNETVAGSNCDHCWTQWERDRIAQSLADAEGYLAEQMEFWLGERYLTDTDLRWTNPVQLTKGYIVGGGVRARTEVTPSTSDFTVDPATITVAQASFPGGTSEIAVVEDETGLDIVPDKIVSSGTNYIIQISQAKLIEWDDLESQAACLTYDAAFPAATWLKLADLTVYREYLDTSDQATITFAPDCDCWACCTTSVCDGTTYTGCAFVLDQEVSRVRINMADESGGSWTCSWPTVCGCFHGSKVSLNYLAGTTTIPGWEQVVISLAHAYMDVEPCGCALFDVRWARDTKENDDGVMRGQDRADKFARKYGHGTAVMLGHTDPFLRRSFLAGRF